MKFAYVEDSFKEYCQLINKWYNEGLLSKDFLNNTQGAGIYYDAQMLDGTAGVFMTGADIFSSASAASAETEGWEAVPMADVTRTGTETITLGRTPNGDPLSMRWNVTTGVEDDRLANVLGFINWFFTEEGTMISNFGTLGETYTIDDDGNVQFTDLILKDPNGYGSMAVYAIYTNNNDNPFHFKMERTELTYDNEVEATVYDTWLSNMTSEYIFNYQLTSEESTRYNALATDVVTTMQEHMTKFMTGDEALTEESWQSFQDTLKSLGMDEMQEIVQAAFDRGQ